MQGLPVHGFNPREYIRGRDRPAFLYFPAALRKQLEQGNRLFLLFIALHIHDDELGLAILGDQQRFARLGQGRDDFGRMTLEI